MQAFDKRATRACHTSPVDFGRPRKERIGTIPLNCFSVRGIASGLASAAAVIALPSSQEGMMIIGRVDFFDIPVNLAGLARRKMMIRHLSTRFANAMLRHLWGGGATLRIFAPK